LILAYFDGWKFGRGVDIFYIAYNRAGVNIGKDDYSLKVENLPKAPPPKGQMDLLSAEGD